MKYVVVGLNLALLIYYHCSDPRFFFFKWYYSDSPMNKNMSLRFSRLDFIPILYWATFRVNIDPKVYVKGKKAFICDGVPSTVV